MSGGAYGSVVTGQAELHQNPIAPPDGAGSPNDGFLDGSWGTFTRTTSTGTPISVTTQDPFTVGTLLTILRGDGFDAGTTASYDLTIGGAPAGGLSATAPSSPLHIQTFASPITASTLSYQATELMTFGGGGSFGDINAAVVLADPLTALSPTVAGFSDEEPGYAADNVLTFTTESLAILKPDGNGNIWITLDLGGSQAVDSLLMLPRERVDTMQIQKPDGQGGWDTFATYTNSAYVMDVIRLESSVGSMEQVRFFIENPGAGDFRISAIGALVPEPGALGLLALAGLIMLRRRK